MPLQRSDFPALDLDIVPPTKGGEVNVLILFHGLGDSKGPFTSFGNLTVSTPNEITGNLIKISEKHQPSRDSGHISAGFYTYPSAYPWS